MFATSTKTATFLPTLTPIPGAGCGARPRRAPLLCAPAPGRVDRPPEDRLLVDEALALPARVLCRVVRLRRLDRRTTLVGRRPEAFLDEAVAHGVRFARRVDDEQVDGSDVAAGANRGPDRQHGAADDVAPRFRDDDRGVREEHQLAHEVRGAERCGRAVTEAIATHGDECLDIRDPGRSDPVLHAPGCSPAASEAPPFRPDRRVRGPHGGWTREARLQPTRVANDRPCNRCAGPYHT